MNLESQVVSLDLAKRLKELKVEKNSLYYWQRCLMCNDDWSLSEGKASDYEQCSAFTVAELGEMLPFIIMIGGYPAEQFFYATDPEWNVDENNKPTTLLTPKTYYCVYMRMQPNFIKKEFLDTSEANARAKMLIYLIENKLYEPK
jgi:hypothetical protein